ncbi:MAG: ERAP1-like C-terminal domain-containing protein, partial [Bryobacteraceae bacterium]
MSMDCDQNKATVRLSQERFLPLGSNGTTAQVWQIPVCIRYGNEVGEERECSLLSQTQSSWTLKGRGCPTFLEGNDNAIGYYRTDYRGSLTAQLTKVANARLSDPERVDFMGDIESLASAGKLPVADALGLAQDFAGDPERHVVQSALEV